jgi:hypothetical protein
VQHLPPEAVSRDQPEWTVERELAAQQIEVTGEVVRMLVMTMRLWVDAKHRDRVVVPDPYRVPRPAEVEALRQDKVQPPANEGEVPEWPPRLRVSGAALAQQLVGVKHGD